MNCLYSYCKTNVENIGLHLNMGFGFGRSTLLISVIVLVASLAYYGCMFVNINYEMCRIINAPLKDVFSFMYRSENIPQYHPLA